MVDISGYWCQKVGDKSCIFTKGVMVLVVYHHTDWCCASHYRSGLPLLIYRCFKTDDRSLIVIGRSCLLTIQTIGVNHNIPTHRQVVQTLLYREVYLFVVY